MTPPAESVHSFVFADLAGFSALTEAHGDARAAEAAAGFCAEVRRLLPSYGAEEVKALGDGMLLRVPEAEPAVRLAARIVGDVGTRRGALGVRAGLHTGTAVRHDGDWFGAAVNVAARVAALATAGEALVTGATVRAAGHGIPQAALRLRGTRRLKNIREPVEVFVLASAPDAGVPVDPVCRMVVDPAEGHRLVHAGVERWFCSEACRDAFLAAPATYAAALAPRRSGNRLVSDEARERAARRLRRAYLRGRLTADELEERSEIVWAARTRADLQAATHDLPRRRRVSPWLLPFMPVALLVRRARRAWRRRRARRR